MLPPPPKRPVAKPLSITNVKKKKQMEYSSCLQSSAIGISNNDNTMTQPVEDIVKKFLSERNVLQDNNNAILSTDIGMSNIRNNMYFIGDTDFQRRSLRRLIQRHNSSIDIVSIKKLILVG